MITTRKYGFVLSESCHTPPSRLSSHSDVNLRGGWLEQWFESSLFKTRVSCIKVVTWSSERNNLSNSNPEADVSSSNTQFHFSVSPTRLKLAEPDTVVQRIPLELLTLFAQHLSIASTGPQSCTLTASKFFPSRCSPLPSFLWHMSELNSSVPPNQRRRTFDN
jgi:hypothetical protein